MHDLPYFEQHLERINYMPWRYHLLKPKIKNAIKAHQKAWQETLCNLETIDIRGEVFISPKANLFAEPGRTIIIEDGAVIGADCFLHGPIHIGKNVGINPNCHMDGGKKGIYIGQNTRIAAQCKLFAFNHGTAANSLINEQPVTSEGIHIGEDVWLGAGVGITDGTHMGNHSVAAMNATVTRSVGEYKIVAGSPARVIGDRLDKPGHYRGE
ncbi:acyltransferase [Salinibius halmophilus]|uniref:acyltransferase n=1 Tax=Salinibius halmophilus TaxID=1853216 RepID=UPI000E65FF24|nr:acyltransferase [Salinibius halmophilus]